MTINYINWNPELFQGFYESNLYNSDMLDSIGDEETQFDFVEGGYEEFERAVAERCTKSLWNNLHQDRDIITEMEFVKLHSPKYYNFETDKLEIKIECDWQALEAYARNNIEDFNEYLADNFTSYDGFTSFVPNNTREFFDNLDSDFDRLADVLIEWYIRKNLDSDAYYEECNEIGYDTLWEYVAPINQTEETKGE